MEFYKKILLEDIELVRIFFSTTNIDRGQTDTIRWSMLWRNMYLISLIIFILKY